MLAITLQHQRLVDTDNDGTYDTLEVETRHFNGPRLFDNSDIPMHEDNQTVVKEKIYLDKADPDIMRLEITTIDNALTQPWTVSRFVRREHMPIWEEYKCGEDRSWSVIGGRLYLIDSESYYMPVHKDQPPPDPKLFQKYLNRAENRTQPIHRFWTHNLIQ